MAPDRHLKALSTPTEMQLDLLTAIARLEQIRNAGGWEQEPVVADRVLTCDLPRLKRYLTKETLEWWAEMESADGR